MQSIRVLVVDDDKNYYTLVQKMLAREVHQYKVEWASTYEMARAIAHKARHDVYLVDYRLGSHDGLDLLHELHGMGIDAPFILMTGYSDGDFDAVAMAAGVSDYLDKSDLKPGILMRTISYALQRRADVEALRESEENYRTLLEEASDGIFILDEDGRIILANSTMEHMLGERPGALIGVKPQTLIGGTLTVSAMFPIQNITSGQTVIREQRIRRKGEEHLPVEISAKLVRSGRLQCIVRDISHRKMAEVERDTYIQRLTILQQIDAEINRMLNINYVLSLALDASVRLAAANAGFISTFENGQLRLEQAIGHYTQFQPGDYLPHTSLLDEVVETQQARLVLDVSEYPAYSATIATQTRALMLIPLNSYERLLGVLNLETDRDDRFNEDLFDFIKLIAARVAVAVENSQLYQIAQDQLTQLQELYAQVSELEQLKTDMIRIAAHDLRNPVGVVVGYLELLEWSLEDKLTDKQREQFKAMARAAQRMEKITTDILSLERIEKMHLERMQSISLNEVVQEVYDEQEGSAQTKRQQFVLNMSDEILEVEGDNAQLREAIANLVSNAIKYTPEGGRVTLSLQREKADVLVKVVDTGYGIPEDQQASLFQPFFRARSDETINIDGTGLGLHLVKNIIERHSGSMIFQSVYGKGSTFGFKMPIAL